MCIRDRTGTIMGGHSTTLHVLITNRDHDRMEVVTIMIMRTEGISVIPDQMDIRGTVIINKVMIITDPIITNPQITSIDRVMEIITTTSSEECITLMLAEGEVGEIITKGEEASLITIIIQITATERIESLVTGRTEATAAKAINQSLEQPKSTTMEMGKEPRNQ